MWTEVLSNKKTSSLRSKRFQSSYYAKGRAGAKNKWKGEGEGEKETFSPLPSPPPSFLFSGFVQVMENQQQQQQQNFINKQIKLRTKETQN